MKKHAKVIRVSSDFIEVMYQNSTTEKFKYGIFPQDLRPKDSFVEIDESIEEGEYHVTIKEGAPFELLCTCTQECDCQNPPPADWDGKTVHGESVIIVQSTTNILNQIPIVRFTDKSSTLHKESRLNYSWDFFKHRKIDNNFWNILDLIQKISIR